MSREITANAIAASEAGSGYSLVLMADLDFVSGHVRAHTGAGSIWWGGLEFVGVGKFGGVDAVEESAELQAISLAFGVTGVSPEFIATALGEQYRGRSAIVYVAFLDESGILVDEPVKLWAGRMDTMPIQLGQVGTVKIKAENKLADWERARVQRYTNEEQQRLFPSDKGLEFVSQTTEKQLIWGRTG